GTRVPVSSCTAGFAGTSGACPHVGGLAALLFSAKLSATNVEVRAALEDTCHPTIDPTLGEYTGYGKIDCKAAVDRLLSGTTQPVAPRFLFAAPVAGDPDAFSTAQSAARPRPGLEFYGVGLEPPAQAQVRRDGQL